MSNHYGQALGNKFPYVDSADFYSIGLEAIQNKMDTYSKEKSNGKSFENYMMGNIRYSMGAYAKSITNKNKLEQGTRLYPMEDEDGRELGGVEHLQSTHMDRYIGNSQLTVDTMLKVLDHRSKYVVEQIVLKDRTRSSLAIELNLTVAYISRIYENAIEKTGLYLEKINYLEGEYV